MLCNSCYSSCCTCCTPSNCVPIPTTTTTTTTTTLCPDPLPCDEAYVTDCIVYSGCDEDCSTIQTGDTLTEVFAKLFEMYEECNGPITSTTTVAPVIEPICLTYAAVGGCAAACPLDCNTYYTSSVCVGYINTNNALQILGCTLYTNALGTIPAPDGWYSKPGGLCIILGSSYNNGEVTGVTSCP